MTAFPSLMVDLETLGTGPDAPVVQIGACAFDPDSSSPEIGTAMTTININVTPDPVATRADFGTVKWWMEQSEEARESVFEGERFTESEALVELNVYIKHFCEEGFTIWAMPPLFDVAKLEAMYKRCNRVIPWKYNSSRCLRTLADVAGATKEDRILPSVPHVAGFDAEAQAKTAIKYHRMLKDVR